MADQLVIMDECDKCVDYVAMVSDGKPWKCICCGLSEGTIYLGQREGVFLWHRYRLPCGHESHERCFRRWCYQEECVGCPTCGPIQMTAENQYCMYCKNWGHPRKECPVLHLRFYTANGKEKMLSVLHP
jgi:hypothetical protein